MPSFGSLETKQNQKKLQHLPRRKPKTNMAKTCPSKGTLRQWDQEEKTEISLQLCS